MVFVRRGTGRHLGLAQPHPRNDDVAECVEKDCRICRSPGDVGGVEQHRRRLGKQVEDLRKTRAVLIEIPDARNALNCRTHQIDEAKKCSATVSPDLPFHQINTLDAVSPFVDVVEPVVAIEVLDWIVPGVAAASENLDGPFVAFQAVLRRPGFYDGRQQPKLFPEPALLVSLFLDRKFVHQGGAVERHRETGRLPPRPSAPSASA